MEIISNLFDMAPFVALFITLSLGYMVGKITIGRFVLGGVAGTLLMGVIIGQFGVHIDPGVKSIFFALFIYAVGYQGGAQFFKALNFRTINILLSAVEPTKDGHLLYHYAKQTIEQARTFDKVALSLAYGGLENVSIAYSSAIPHRFLVLLRIQLAADFPMMRVNFLVRNRNEIKEGLQNGEYQFGIVNVHDSRAIHSLDATFLGHFEFVPFVQKGGELASVAPDRVLTALRNSKQFVLRSLIEEGMGEKVIVSSNHEEVDQLALVVKMVEAGLGWAILPRTFAHSEFSNNHIEPVEASELLEGFKFGFGLWCQPSKQIGDVKDSIMRVVTAYWADHIYKQDSI